LVPSRQGHLVLIPAATLQLYFTLAPSFCAHAQKVLAKHLKLIAYDTVLQKIK